MRLAASGNRPGPTTATSEAEMRAMFWSIAVFVCVGLGYIIVIGALRR
jgi:hypothetical protein